jgi:putative oxidoreductase
MSVAAPLRTALDPGSPSTRAGLVARLAAAAVLLQAGVGKFATHDAYTVRFERWGFPAPGAVAVLVGVAEVACGLALLLGVAPRPAALAVIATMAGAVLTAGRVDGGSNLWLPPLVALAALVVLLRGAGSWALGGALPPVRRVAPGGAPGARAVAGDAGAAGPGGAGR